MPNPILITVPTALSSNMPAIRAAMDVAKAQGFAGVRLAVGVSNYPFSTTPADKLHLIDTKTVQDAVVYANQIGLGTVRLLFGYGPKISPVLASTFTDGVVWPVVNRPPQGNAATINGVVYSSLWNYIGRVIWQQLFDAAWNNKGSLTLQAEWFNEPGKGGVGGPFYGKKGNKQLYSSAYAGHYGTIEPAFWDYAYAVCSVVNFRGVTTSAFTLEGSEGDSDPTQTDPDNPSDPLRDGTLDAVTELSTVTGTAAANLIALATTVSTNRYADSFASPVYNATAMKAQFSAKVQQQLTRMAANSLIGSKTKTISEFGIRVDRCPKCTHPNSVRQDLIDQMKAESGMTQAGFYTSVGSATNGDAQFYTFEFDKSPLVYNGSAVPVSG